MSEVKTNKISSLASNNDITLDPDGTGNTIIASGEVGVGTTTPATYTDYVSSSNAPSVVVAGSQPSYVLADTDVSGSSSTLGITKSGDSTVINNLGGGNIDFYNNGGHRMRISDAGSLFVNTTNTTPNPGMNLGPSGGMAQGNNNGTSGFYFNYITRNGSLIGSITQSGTTGVAFNTSSDYRLKENVVDMTGAITRVKSLAPKRFNWVAEDDDRTVDGFLAHEAQTVVPEAVTGTHNEVDDDGNAVMQGIDQSKLVPLLTGALKEAIAKIEALEARVTALEDA